MTHAILALRHHEGDHGKFEAAPTEVPKLPNGVTITHTWLIADDLLADKVIEAAYAIADENGVHRYGKWLWLPAGEMQVLMARAALRLKDQQQVHEGSI